MRRAAKRDSSEGAIVAALEATGWTVEKVSSPGFPDLVCVRRGVVVLLEVKSRGGEMEPKQVALHGRWERAHYLIPVVQTPEEALEAVRGRLAWCYRDFLPNK